MLEIPFTGNAGDFLKIGVAAAARGEVDRVRAILQAKPNWLFKRGSHGRTMLWEAAHRGRLEVVQELCERGADRNACGTHYTPYFVEVSPYCIARYKRHHAVADFLIEQDVQLDSHTAAFLGDLPLLKQHLGRGRKRLDESHPQHVLLPKGSAEDYGAADAPWATPLCYALRGGSLEVVTYLLERGARVQGFENELFIAADDVPARVELLLEYGADPHLAPRTHPGDEELFAVLSRFGVPAESSVEHSEELVYLCRGDRGGNPEEVRELLDAGADVNHRDAKGKSALHRAARAGFVPALDVLLAAGATVDQEDDAGETALFDALRSTIRSKDRVLLSVRRLLEAGADPEHVNAKGKSARDVARARKGPGSRTLVRRLDEA